MQRNAKVILIEIRKKNIGTRNLRGSPTFGLIRPTLTAFPKRSLGSP